MGKRNYVGMLAGRLEVLETAGYSASGHCQVLKCKCSCGNILNVRSSNFISGHTRSCGCLQEETRGQHSLRHGHTVGRNASHTYAIWNSMKARCTNPRNDAFKYYGARGITICDEWKNSFDCFLKDMGPAPNGLEIDRIDNDKGYTRENCRWTTRTENMRNTRSTKMVILNGVELSILEICDKYAIPVHAFRRRVLNWGMTPEHALASCLKGLRKNRRSRIHEKKTTNP